MDQPRHFSAGSRFQDANRQGVGSLARRLPGLRAPHCAGWLFLLLLGAGCTPLTNFIDNGYKVGPNYMRPPAPLADAWIDAGNPQVQSALADDYAWWTAFDDATLDQLVRIAYAQNVNLRVATARVFQARAQRAIAAGSLFPQQQALSGAYARVNTSENLANSPPVSDFGNWGTGFNASWEADFWGKIRRTIESADNQVDASVEDYDNVMVTLIGDVATAYVQYRIFQQQIAYTRQNVNYQKQLVRIAESQWKAGATNELGTLQSRSLLAQNESLIPGLEIGLRQANNQLCVLLGMPPMELAAQLGEGPIPTAPPEVFAGVPADLIRRRPDLRAAERQIAAQNAQIGVAEAAFYPAFYISGGFGYQAETLDLLFHPKSVAGQIGPGFQWNILNYGRIANNVRLQDFTTQELAAVYQQKVLNAAREVDDGIAVFTRSRQEAEFLEESVKDARRAVVIARSAIEGGAVDYTPLFVAQQFLTGQENALARANGNVALGLISVYRALGGGWELRLDENRLAGELGTAECIVAGVPQWAEELPAPHADIKAQGAPEPADRPAPEPDSIDAASAIPIDGPRADAAPECTVCLPARFAPQGVEFVSPQDHQLTEEEAVDAKPTPRSSVVSVPLGAVRRRNDAGGQAHLEPTSRLRLSR